MPRKKAETPSAVSFKNSNGTLQLVFTHPTERNAKGHRKQKYVSTGLPDTIANRSALRAGMVADVEKNLALGTIDDWLADREAQKQQAIQQATNVTLNVTLNELWKSYTEYATKARNLAESTVERDYGKIAKRLAKFPRELDKPDKAIEVRDWLLDSFSPETTRRTLVQLNACCKWAVKSNHIETNGFEGLSKDIKKTTKDTNREAFTAAERDAIIGAFETNRFSSRYSPTPHSFYTNWVKMLFKTGARPEELTALTWDKVSEDCSEIRFDCAMPSDTKILGGMKTKASVRTFKCNYSLQELLRRMKFESEQTTTPHNIHNRVFNSPQGKAFDSHNFSNRIWKPVVEGLVRAGEVKRYLPQYNARHTLITLLLDAGVGVKDIAAQLGNSPEIIFKHYGKAKDVAFVEV